MIRPILTGDVMDPDLIRLCVEFATDACEVSYILTRLFRENLAYCLEERKSAQPEPLDSSRPHNSVPLLLWRYHITPVLSNQANGFKP